ncbi:MAG: serine hydroxymethyltransferase [Candidatus Levyibacteriota bacterium]
MKTLKKSDPKLYNYILQEAKRQKEGLEMIPSENYTSQAVLECNGSILTNKYSEGFSHKRYYNGNEVIDSIEDLAMTRAKKLFGVEHVNVQPYSGSPANFAVYVALCNRDDVVMGLSLTDGGHLTHGWKASATGKLFKTVMYGVKPDGHVDIDQVWKLAKENKPKLIWMGATAYMFEYEFDKFADIADSVGAYLAADIAHVAGLVVAGAHMSPVKYAHIVTTTTHKTLRGPRGGMIMVTKRGLAKDPELAKKIDMAVFPGLQGGPHDHQTAGIATALLEASKPSFKTYGHQIVKNAKALATELKKKGVKLVGNGTENHLLLLDVSNIFGPGGGAFAADALQVAGITVNKNTIPAEPMSPFYPSGVRMGTPALTTRGVKEKDMKKIAAWIADAINAVGQYKMPSDKEVRAEYLKKFKKEVVKNKKLLAVEKEVKKFASKLYLP